MSCTRSLPMSYHRTATQTSSASRSDTSQAHRKARAVPRSTHTNAHSIPCEVCPPEIRTPTLPALKLSHASEYITQSPRRQITLQIPPSTLRSANRGSSHAANNADNIAPRLKEKFSSDSADPRCSVNLLPARILTDVMICPRPNPPKNNAPQPIPIDGATANPPNPSAPADIPTSRLCRSFGDTVTPPRNAPQNFAIINRPLCESNMDHCFASRGRIGPNSAVPRPASINP